MKVWWDVVSLVWTTYGAAAYSALRSAVAELKRDDPLAPVTVLVPTQLCAVITRRTLAGGLDGRPGVAGLSVSTVDRLAERLAAPTLVGSGRRPATNAVLAAVWRRALAEGPRVFTPVAAHPATVRALVDAHRELRDAGGDALASVASCGEPVAGDLVRLHRRVVDLLADGWYDVADLRRTAVDAVRHRPALGREVGHVVLFQPQELPPGVVALVRELAGAGALTVIAARTGDARADAGVLRLVRQVTDGPEPPGVTPATAMRIVHASDSDDEVRCVVRLLAATLRRVPAHRVAVLYGAAEPYARLLAEHLDAAGVAWNGTAVRPTLDRTLPRTLLDVLALPDHGWRRDEVLAVLSAAPVRGPDGHRVPASRWERISRIAGVVADGDWDTRLKGYAAQERAAADEERAAEAPRRGLIARRERDATAAQELREFVADLRARLHHGASLRRWSQLADWALDTFRVLLGDPDGQGMPEEEARAVDRIIRVLSGLAGLDAIEEATDLTALRLTLELELAEDLPRHGRFGRGVLVGPLSAAIGLDADEVFVVGLAEDLVPGRLGGDALLPDHVRAATGGRLTPLRDRIDRRQRHLLAAFAAAPVRVASFPRGDLRRSSARLPSRWLLPSLRAVSGDPAADIGGWQALAQVDGSPSFAASLARTADLATAQEWRTRAALAARHRRLDLAAALPADVVVRRAVAMLRARGGDTLSRFDGDLSGHDLPDPTAGAVLSPTALEAWTRCPHAYFVARLLGVEPVESPEELVQISPLELGNLIHTALDRFFTQQAETGAVPGGATAWTAEQRRRLRDITGEVAADLTARGATGHPLLWRQELDRVLADLDRLLDDDERLRSATGRRQIHSELAFGIRGAAPVELPLPDGRTIRLRGSADRVDRAGDAIVVVDYKTGSARSFTELGEDNPTGSGAKLQLPVYAYAARAALATPEAPVSAEYWFLRKDAGKRVVLPLTPAVQRAYAEALAVIADGIAGGLFPHRPPAQDSWGDYVECRYCDPDGLGVAEHRDRWTRKRDDPRLAAYLRLIDPEAATGQPPSAGRRP